MWPSRAADRFSPPRGKTAKCGSICIRQAEGAESKRIWGIETGGQIGKFENCAGDFQTGVKMAQIVSKFESTNAHISTVELI